MTELRKLFIADESTGRLAELDGLTDHLITITHPHGEVHEGHSYNCTVVDTAMGNNDTLSLCFKTMAAPKRAHLVVSFATMGKGHLDIVEGPTWDASSGTLAPIYNRNRSSAGTSTLEEKQSTGAFVVNDNLNANPTNLAGGAAVDTHYTFAANRTEGGSRGLEEWVLAAATLYAVRYTADAVSNAGYLQLTWYEHTDAA